MIRSGRLRPARGAPRRAHLRRDLPSRDPMSPINPPHDDAVDELNEWSFEALPREPSGSGSRARSGSRRSTASRARRRLAAPEGLLDGSARRPEDVLLADRGLRQHPRQGSGPEGQALRRGGDRATTGSSTSRADASKSAAIPEGRSLPDRDDLSPRRRGPAARLPRRRPARLAALPRLTPPSGRTPDARSSACSPR